jgi:hypothetical protein
MRLPNILSQNTTARDTMAKRDYQCFGGEQRMLTSLELTERHIREGEARVARQRQICEDLARASLVEPASLARDLLHMMQQSLDLSKWHRRLALAAVPMMSERHRTSTNVLEQAASEVSLHSRLSERPLRPAAARRPLKRLHYAPMAAPAELRNQPQQADVPHRSKMPLASRQKKPTRPAVAVRRTEVEPRGLEGSDGLNTVRLAIGEAVSTGVAADALIGLLLEGSVHVLEHAIPREDRDETAMAILQALAGRLLVDHDADST